MALHKLGCFILLLSSKKEGHVLFLSFSLRIWKTEGVRTASNHYFAQGSNDGLPAKGKWITRHSFLPLMTPLHKKITFESTPAKPLFPTHFSKRPSSSQSDLFLCSISGETAPGLVIFIDQATWGGSIKIWGIII